MSPNLKERFRLNLPSEDRSGGIGQNWPKIGEIEASPSEIEEAKALNKFGNDPLLLFPNFIITYSAFYEKEPDRIYYSNKAAVSPKKSKSAEMPVFSISKKQEFIDVFSHFLKFLKELEKLITIIH